MPADLTTIYDHPARVLRAAADSLMDRFPATPEEKAEATTLHVAAATLDTYEREHGVTFAALSTEGLKAVREEWEKGVNGDVRNDLFGTVRDLLGLDD